MNMREPTSPVSGKRILVVEDWLMIARELEDMLRDLKCDVLGPIADLRSALEAATHEPCDGAILDVDLNGQTVFPVADELRRRGIPFIFSTGYDTESVLPEQYRRCPCIEKPFSFADLEAIVRAAFGGGTPDAPADTPADGPG